MSTTISQAEASKPLQREQKKMQECFKCKAAGFPNQLIGFEKIGESYDWKRYMETDRRKRFRA
jgi:hypothetical protein